MAVNSTHPDYEASALDWSRARDVLAGEDAVKAAAGKYLPRMQSQTDNEFSMYCCRASFFNATARTAEGYVGLIFRRPPFVKVPEVLAHGRRADGHQVGSGQADRAGGGGGETNGTATPVARALSEFVNDADMLGTTLAGYA